MWHFALSSAVAAATGVFSFGYHHEAVDSNTQISGEKCEPAEKNTGHQKNIQAMQANLQAISLITADHNAAMALSYQLRPEMAMRNRPTEKSRRCYPYRLTEKSWNKLIDQRKAPARFWRVGELSHHNRQFVQLGHNASIATATWMHQLESNVRQKRAICYNAEPRKDRLILEDILLVSFW